MENGTPQLVARDLRRSFRMGPRRIEVLRGISMEVRRSEAVFLVGASGAGKTTLLYTLAGLERPEEGTVDFEGQRLYTGSSQARKFAVSWFRRTAATFAGGTFRRRATTRGDRARSGE